MYENENPLLPTYYETTGGYYIYKYEGNKLIEVNEMGSSTRFKYNELGLRIKKTNPNGTHSRYFYDESDKLITEIIHTSNNTLPTRLDFLYDESGLLIGFIKDNTEKYFYVRDILQNILGIIDINGSLVVKYTYNAFGEVNIDSSTSNTSLAHLNTFRYKGYYYDETTEMYYCKSRYYVPAWCRWLTPDSIDYLEPESINGLNLYVYCMNNPVNYLDLYGNSPKWVDCLITIGIAALSIALVITSCGAASAAIAPIAFMYFGIAANTTLAITTAVATITSVGLAAFAIADIQSIVTDGQSNYLSFLGDSYDDVKGALYFSSYMYGYLSQFALDGWGRQTSGVKDASKYGHQYGMYVKETAKGNDVTIYNGRGQSVIRFDHSHPHNGMQPHVHKFNWWKFRGEWHWDGKKGEVVPY